MAFGFLFLMPVSESTWNDDDNAASRPARCHSIRCIAEYELPTIPKEPETLRTAKDNPVAAVQWPRVLSGRDKSYTFAAGPESSRATSNNASTHSFRLDSCPRRSTVPPRCHWLTVRMQLGDSVPAGNYWLPFQKSASGLLIAARSNCTSER